MRMSEEKESATHLAVVVTASLVTVLALIAPDSSQAQDANELAQQQMEAIKQQMEAAGMSAEDMEQMESAYKGVMGPIVEQQAAHEAREQAEFESQTAGLGKAVVSVPGKDIELQVTECLPAPDGNFRIRAQASHDSRSDSLWLGGESYYNRTVLQMFLKGVGEYDIWIQPMVNLEDGRFTWSGTADGGLGATEVTVTVDCES